MIDDADDFVLSVKKDNRGGHNEHTPTEENIKLVKALTTHGVQTKYICDHLNISEPTLIKHYKKHMAEARIYAHSKVGQSLFKKAINGDTTSAIFYAKTQMGWREPRDDDRNNQDSDFSEAIDD